MNTARGLALVALVLGLTHAGFSGYWALGGRWLLRTVGEWAVRLADDDPQRAGLVLGTVALVKAAAAVIPALVAYGRMPWPRVWRTISWAGAAGLVLYGGFNVVVSGAVLAGLVRLDGGYDRAAMMDTSCSGTPCSASGDVRCSARSGCPGGVGDR